MLHQTDNMLEIGFDLALEDAAEADEYFRSTGELKGPLHGIPLTLKDQFHIKGLGTSLGYVGWADTFEGRTGTGKEGVFESELVKEFRQLGAIPIGKVCYLRPFLAQGYPPLR
jgi:amidase